jgi:hypothetical protein
MTSTSKPKRLYGFAAMDPAKRAAISALGGKRAQELGHGHRFSSDEARRAGRLGGQAVAQDREHMAEIGAAGGRKRGVNANERRRAALDADPTAAEDSPID